MSQDTSQMILGAAVLAVALPLLYFAVRFIAKVGDRWSAIRLAPLAADIGGMVVVNPPHVRVQREGRQLRISYAPRMSVGRGDSATHINAVHVDLAGLPGAQPWRVIFQVTGLLGQGPKELQIEAQDERLAARLHHAGVIERLASVCTPSRDYVAATYDPHTRLLTLTDDVSPRTLPRAAECERLLEAVLRLAEINELDNAP